MADWLMNWWNVGRCGQPSYSSGGISFNLPDSRFVFQRLFLLIPELSSDLLVVLDSSDKLDVASESELGLSETLELELESEGESSPASSEVLELSESELSEVE